MNGWPSSALPHALSACFGDGSTCAPMPRAERSGRCDDAFTRYGAVQPSVFVRDSVVTNHRRVKPTLPNAFILKGSHLDSIANFTSHPFLLFVSSWVSCCALAALTHTPEDLRCVAYPINLCKSFKQHLRHGLHPLLRIIHRPGDCDR